MQTKYCTVLDLDYQTHDDNSLFSRLSHCINVLRYILYTVVVSAKNKISALNVRLCKLSYLKKMILDFIIIAVVRQTSLNKVAMTLAALTVLQQVQEIVYLFTTSIAV